MSIIRDTLKNPRTGEWSRKNITSATSFIFAMVYSLVGSFWADKQVHEFIIIGFLSLTASLLGLSSWEKKNLKTQSQGKTEDDLTQS